jgi:uncharacterized protein (TIGR02246 family)
MNTKSRQLAAVALVAAVIAGWLFVQNRSATSADEPARKAEEADILKTSEAFARAFERGDAKAIGDFFTEEGEYVDEDSAPVRGRANLEKAYATFFAKRPEIKVSGKTDKVRFLSKDTAIEEGTFTVMAKDRPADSSRFSALYVREDGKWRIAMLKEWGDETTNRADLNDLAWLIGSWETGDAEHKATTSYEWAESKKFIICRFNIANLKDKVATSGSGVQVIGIDPAVDRIRSWTFGADGGIGEANWSHDGDRWVIDSHATLADGTSTSATNQLTRAGDKAFTWRSVERTVEGQRQPDLAAVKVTRVK